MGFSEVEVTLEEGEAQLFVYESKYGEGGGRVGTRYMRLFMHSRIAFFSACLFGYY